MNKQNILFIIFIIILVLTGLVWYNYLRHAPATEEQLPEADPGVRLNELRRLKNLQLDTSLLQDPLFKALRALPPASAATSTAAPLRPEKTPGRANPFAPF